VGSDEDPPPIDLDDDRELAKAGDASASADHPAIDAAAEADDRTRLSSVAKPPICTADAARAKIDSARPPANNDEQNKQKP
jgi:hypothetical protein